MILAWVLYSLVIGLLCGLAAAACERVVREVGLPVRGVWVAAIALTVGMSIAGFVRTRDSATAEEGAGDLVLTLAETGSTAPSFFDRTLTRARELAGMSGDIVISGSRAARELTGDAYARVGATFWLLWLATSAGLLLLLGATFARMWRARSGWREHRIGEWPVLVSQNSGPALVGLIDSAIVVPSWLLQEPEERQCLVVRHEREHQRAGDHFLLTLVCVAVCVLPWNPALWWMLKRARLAVELDCDARVLRSGAEVKSYGMLLLDIAGHAPAARPFTAPALVDARTQLERRVLAMVERHRTGRPLQALACATLALTLGVAACATDMPTAAQIDELDVAEAHEHAVGTGFIVEDETPLYVVDGVIVAEEVARAIPAEDIESIRVLQKDAASRIIPDAGPNGALMVRTRSREPLTVTGQPIPAGENRLRLRSSDVEVRDLTAKVQADEVVVEGARRRVNSTDNVAGVATYTPSRMVSDEEIREVELRAMKSPLIVVDGKVASGTFEMRQLDSGSIESIEVVKGEAARRLYSDPRAVNGVVSITTKKK